MPRAISKRRRRAPRPCRRNCGASYVNSGSCEPANPPWRRLWRSRTVRRNGMRADAELIMIIENQADVTKAVLSELERAPDPRFREIMAAFIRHLHDFAREVKLTEQEFQTAAAYINAVGKKTNDTH